jgi:hypothetical protein
MIKIFFLLALASVASAADTCPNIREYIATTPQTLAQVTASAQTLAGLESKANEDYARLVLAEGNKYRDADKTAAIESGKCAGDSECLKRVAEWLREEFKDMSKKTAEIKAENTNCTEAFAYVYSTQISSGVANSLKQLIALYPENVKLVGDVNLLPIEDAARDSELLNLIYAKKTDFGAYAMGNVGVWYDLQTATGLVRVAGIITSSHTGWRKGTLVQSLQALQKEAIPSYGLDLDRVTAKFVKGQIKHHYNYYFNYNYSTRYNRRTNYGDTGYFGSARTGLGLITFEGVL